MLKKTILTLLILHCFGLVHGQFNLPSYVVPNTDWIKYASSRGNVANGPTAIDANNNMFLTGYTGSSPSSCNILTQKRDSLGNLIFSATYNNGNYDKGNALKVAGTNVHVAGVSYATATNNDYVVIKYSGTGSQQWAYRYDMAGQDDEASDIKVDAAGNSYVTGTARNSNGDLDIVTFKLNPSGTLQWVHVYNGVSNMDDVATGLVIIGGDVFVVGYTTDASNGTDVTVFQLNASTGTAGWQTQINGTANGNDKPNAVTISGADILVCGEIDNVGTGMDALLFRLNGSSGATVFQQIYDYSATNNRATSLVRDSTGNVGVVGTALNGSVYEYHATFYDSTGTLYSVNRETTNLGVSTVNPRIACDTIAHHFYVCGEKLNLSKDIFVYQLTPSGNTSWRKSYDGYNNADIDAAIGLAVNGVGVVYVGALSQNTAGQYDYTAIKINQTPVYFPPDLNSEPVNWNHLYIPNKGQLMRTDTVLANEVLYYSHNTVPEIFIEKNAFDIVYRHEDTVKTVLDTAFKVQHKFLNSNPLTELHEYLPISTKYNYYLGYATSPAIEQLQGHQRIFAPNLYNGIDLHYFSCKGGIKYYFVLKPFATNEIQIKFEGAENVSINGTTGNLVVNCVMGNFELSKPQFYTVNMLGQPVPISGSATWTQNNGIYQIGLPSYNMAQPVIIMVQAVPSGAAMGGFGAKANMDYSTYYGGTGSDQFNDIKTAANGDRYIAGSASNGLFPPKNSTNFYNGGTDIVALKYTADDTLRYATYQGGSDYDEGLTVAVDSKGDAYIGGQTFSTDMLGLNVTGATNQFTNGGASSNNKADGFIAKLVGNNNTLVWRRYVGGSRAETVNSIFIDPSDNFYIAGYSSSSDFPVVNAYKSTLGATTTANPANFDAIFGKFNSNLVAQWITYYGGSANASGGGTSTQDWGFDITVDNQGLVIGCGITDANNFPTMNLTSNNNVFFKNAITGSSDGFLVRFSSTGTPDYSTYFGGDNSDEMIRLYFNRNLNELYFAGNSYKGANFPFVNKAGAYNSTYGANAGYAPFVGYTQGNLTKEWCTKYGKGMTPTKNYSVKGLCVDNVGVVYLSGYTNSDTLSYNPGQPTTVVYKDSIRSAEDGFVAVFWSDKSLYHAHYFGGASNDRILNADVSQNMDLYVTGLTGSSDFPIAYNAITAALIDSTYNGSNDGFISRFKLINYQVTGLETVTKNDLTFRSFPNPTNSKFTLSIDQKLYPETELRVYTLTGQLIYEQRISEDKTEINCNSWANGVYLISISNNKAYNSFKLIKN